MSCAGYMEGDGSQEDNWAHIKWRGQVASAIRGKRGQQFLRDLIDALDNLPVKVLITEDLYRGQYYCAIGAVGLKRKIDMAGIDPDCTELVAGRFDIADQIVREVVYENDESGWDWRNGKPETPKQRWQRMREWAVARLNKEKVS